MRQRITERPANKSIATFNGHYNYASVFFF